MEDIKQYIESTIQSLEDGVETHKLQMEERRNQLRRAGEDYTDDFDYQALKAEWMEMRGMLTAYRDCLTRC